MAAVVLWSDEAKRTFAENIAYLQREWSGKEIQKFIHRTEYVILTIEDNPETYSHSAKSNKVRRALINKRVSLYYRYYARRKQVILLSFWNNHKSPEGLKH